GRTLSQMALYSPEHPSVRGAVEQAHTLLSTALQESAEIALSTHEGKLLANGRTVEDVGESATRPVLQLLQTHGLHSLSFQRGIELREMSPFFRMAVVAEMKKANMPVSDYLLQQNVQHIRLNEARYAKIGEDQTVGRGESEDTGSGANVREE